jgi:hypothetical protein
VQTVLRRVFRRWGRPRRLRVDNGIPWGAMADLPSELTLWLLGLKQAKIPSPQGVYLLVDDDASSPFCPRTGS